MDVCRPSDFDHVIMMQYDVTVTSEWYHSDVIHASLLSLMLTVRPTMFKGYLFIGGDVSVTKQ